MTGRTLGRRIVKLENAPTGPNGAMARAIDDLLRKARRTDAIYALVNFARSLAGTLDLPPPKEEELDFAERGGPGNARLFVPTPTQERRRVSALRPRPEPELPPGPRFDPSFGGRVIAAHGGLGTSADALIAMPPPPEPEPPPVVPRERYPWEHWGVPPPEGWVDNGEAGQESGETA